MSEFDKQSSDFAFLKSTISFISSLVLIMLFCFVVYGFAIDDKFFGRLGDYIADILIRFLAWLAEYIVLPITAFLGFMRFIVWVFAGESETVYEYNVEVKPSPTTQSNAANTPPEPQKMADPIGVGETIIVTEHTDNGGIFHHTTRGSELYRQVISKNAARQTREYNDKINQKSDKLLRGHYDKMKTRVFNE